MERLVELHIRDKINLTHPIHKMQFAYLKGKSTELAAHHLVTNIEDALFKKQVALCAFVDVQGAYDNTNFNSISRALKKRDIDPAIRNWIINMLKDREISAKIGRTKVSVTASKGCPQGGVLSPLLWSLVVDELIAELNEEGIHTIGYADDLAITIRGPHKDTIHSLMEYYLNRIQAWCSGHGLSVNPAKTIIVPFHTGRSFDLPQIKFHNCPPIPYSEEVTYLGIKLDRKLSWIPHLQCTIAKARRALWACRSMAGANWGTSPKMMLYIYSTMIRPIITYGCFIWWPVITLNIGVDLCTKMQRTASLMITGCIKSCPTVPMEALIGLTPLHLQVIGTAAKTATRLQCAGTRLVANADHSTHGSLPKYIPQWDNLTSNPDNLIPRLSFVRNFVTDIPSRASYTYTHSHPPIADNPDAWFTDGSKTDLGCGAGIFNRNEEISISLEPHTSVFQSELYAITVCAKNLIEKGTHSRSIFIYSDSQAAIKAVWNPSCSSRTVLECKDKLNQLGLTNSVNLTWIPGHSNLEGNEHADRLANVGSAVPRNNDTITLPLGWAHVVGSIDNWISELKLAFWREQPGLRQSRSLINLNLHKKLPMDNRRQLRLFIGYLTGQHKTMEYLHRIGVSSTPTCRLCSSDNETTEHILLLCPRLDLVRFQIFGKPTLVADDIKNTPTRIILSFLNKAEALLD